MENIDVLVALEDALDDLMSDDSESCSGTESGSGSESGPDPYDDNNIDNIALPGCDHYVRKCRLVCPVCDEVFTCRICHDDVQNHYSLPIEKQHTLDRYEVSEIVCYECDKRQNVSNECSQCGITFGTYYCETCHLYDDNGIDKDIFHCDGCKMCRIGNGQEYFHCDNCNTCINILNKDTHKCQNLKDEYCPVCSEIMSTSREQILQLKCSHWIHIKCYQGMIEHQNFTCPFCSKLIVDLTQYYQMLDIQIANTPMPDEYKDKNEVILCNECLKTNNIPFHFYGLKCPDCNSYNTKMIKN